MSDCKIYINSFGNNIQIHENLKNLAVRGLLNVCSNLQCLDLVSTNNLTKKKFKFIYYSIGLY